jgi:phosphatidylserine synthase
MKDYSFHLTVAGAFLIIVGSFLDNYADTSTFSSLVITSFGVLVFLGSLMIYNQKPKNVGAITAMFFSATCAIVYWSVLQSGNIFMPSGALFVLLGTLLGFFGGVGGIRK